MFESYSAYGAYQVAEARLTELSTIAEKQQHGAEQPARPARWSRRILANVGTRLIALGQHLARIEGIHRPDLYQALGNERA